MNYVSSGFYKHDVFQSEAQSCLTFCQSEPGHYAYMLSFGPNLRLKYAYIHA